ncbi:act minimal PKS acyl carrier protein [Streptoalloteichus tenebrarius]|uniref:Act minimal PKS acyl carrier protein n=1 Tax=Streptoalloteichus tenebrarius (strain ATCC 17920 / DSM 40477 / JCM 4838 / CBS 697.72 / NBRC 16177 / NCIMB 11028 / NRRL B-12390 / A12253. 1 / ISP 5477) TaxID=1933 RepID=A0ABT1HXN0_STRSD|nr:acyl carrier protein [Streptoalloteichus tenebrarius]MCP2260256.1 act minimal PKS acyl carrier protein [Streptoalloteichus tenebrarius]BFF03005.1 acyl carrier protein [Streptoalloteichus tenebrarius]
MTEFTFDELKRLMRESAGEAEHADLDGGAPDATFEELGYDSLALLEVSARIQRELGVVLSDEAVTTVESPRELVALVNEQLAART